MKQNGTITTTGTIMEPCLHGKRRTSKIFFCFTLRQRGHLKTLTSLSQKAKGILCTFRHSDAATLDTQRVASIFKHNIYAWPLRPEYIRPVTSSTLELWSPDRGFNTRGQRDILPVPAKTSHPQCTPFYSCGSHHHCPYQVT